MIKAERFVLAELHLKKASKLQNYEDEETLQLFQLARTKRLYDPICEVSQGGLHYGSKQGDIETSNFTLSHERGSERSERACERVAVIDHSG